MSDLATKGDVLYALACVLAPIAWGLVVVWITTRLEQYAAKGKPDDGRQPAKGPEYHI